MIIPDKTKCQISLSFTVTGGREFLQLGSSQVSIKQINSYGFFLQNLLLFLTIQEFEYYPQRWSALTLYVHRNLYSPSLIQYDLHVMPMPSEYQEYKVKYNTISTLQVFTLQGEDKRPL